MAKFFIENYGCQMNVSESASLRDILVTHAHEPVSAATSAEVVIINTCSVRNTAEARIIGRLGYYRGLRNHKNLNIKVILMGCMAQNIGLELKKKYRDVLALVWGTFNKDGIVDFLDHLDAASDFTGLDNYRFMEAKPQEKYPSKSFIPISHGCDNFCSYCIVPYVRGREVHRKASGIIDNIKRLIDSGVKEAVLLGQNVNSYQDEKIRFPELLNRIANETSIERLGFMTSHPKDFSSELASVIAGNDNIMKNIHLPLQSGNDRILKLMNRKYTAEEYLDKIEKTKEIKGVVLTTDIIVGFPSETEDEFFDTLNLVKKAGFYESFTYHFNARAGTPADKLSGQLSEDVKKRRLTELMETQNSVAKEKMSALIGRRSTVLIDSISKKRKNEVSGRSHQGLMVFLEGSREDLGKIIPIEYTGLSGNGLAAKTCAN